MKDYIEYLNLPSTALFVLAVIFLVLNLVGEILEVKGKIVPEFMKIRKWFARRKKEREAIAEMMVLLPEYKKSLDEFNAHYSKDNITMRNNWMHSVDDRQEQDHQWIERLDEKLDKIDSTLLDIRIEDLRSEIISFASYVADGTKPVTRQQFNRIFRIDGDYDKILEEANMTNGETDTAMQIIREAYEEHMHSHSFVEDTRWPNQSI